MFHQHPKICAHSRLNTRRTDSRVTCKKEQEYLLRNIAGAALSYSKEPSVSLSLIILHSLHGRCSKGKGENSGITLSKILVMVE